MYVNCSYSVQMLATVDISAIHNEMGPKCLHLSSMHSFSGCMTLCSTHIIKEKEGSTDSFSPGYLLTKQMKKWTHAHQ